MSGSSTPVSSATSYATPGQFLVAYDVRQIGDLIGDADARVDATAILTDPNVAAALNAASGEIESACLVGEKYNPTNLNALTGMSAARLQKLCADLAFWNLLVRRYPTAQATETYKAAQETLQKLRYGELVFGLQENMDAGKPNSTFVSQNTICQLGLNTTIARRMFGVRGNVRRIGGGGCSGSC